MSSNISDENIPGIQISGGTITLKEQSKGSLTIKFFVDDKQICKKHLSNDTLTLKWELNSPLNGSRLAIQLGERKPFRVTRKVHAQVSASFDDCQRLLSSNPVQLNELKLNDDPTITLNILAQSPGVLQTIMNRNVEVSEQIKSVLNRLGKKARKFLGVVLTECGSITCDISVEVG